MTDRVRGLRPTSTSLLGYDGPVAKDGQFMLRPSQTKEQYNRLDTTSSVSTKEKNGAECGR